MSEYLYVCHFSNGHIKVGRSIEPKSRIEQHAERVACMGIELVEHHIVKCVGNSVPAESALIEKCTELAAVRNKSEWFEGLCYPDICELCNGYAAVAFNEIEHKSEITRMIKRLRNWPLNLTQLEITRLTGISQSRISRWESGDVPSGAEDAIKLLALMDSLENSQEKAA